MYQDEIKVPKDRVAVLIGKKGETKRELEKKFKVDLEIDSQNNLVTIKSKESITVYNTKFIIKAIARGFSPKTAELLSREGFCFELIQIEDFSGKSKKKLIRLKSRVIGTGGKSREMIEQMTNTHICMYGKTVGIIGEVENVSVARLALERLLGGAPHGHVYKFIQDMKKKAMDND